MQWVRDKEGVCLKVLIALFFGLSKHIIVYSCIFGHIFQNQIAIYINESQYSNNHLKYLVQYLPLLK